MHKEHYGEFVLLSLLVHKYTHGNSKAVKSK